jgi:N-acetylmuramoyl-L-alanine amidase
MKKLVFVFLITLLSYGLSYKYIQPITIFAQTKENTKIYSIKENDTSRKIAVKFGVSELDLKKINKTNIEKLQQGEKIIIPKTITPKEKDLLMRLVHAEAKGEPFEGKVAVAAVVLNRVEHEKFPNTIEKVIKEEGQFQPVDNGAIKEPAEKVDQKAVQTALALEGQDNGSLYFYNPEIADNHWQKTRKVTDVIGNHYFSK